jgi:hypothetical protein
MALFVIFAFLNNAICASREDDAREASQARAKEVVDALSTAFLQDELQKRARELEGLSESARQAELERTKQDELARRPTRLFVTIVSRHNHDISKKLDPIPPEILEQVLRLLSALGGQVAPTADLGPQATSDVDRLCAEISQYRKDRMNDAWNFIVLDECFFSQRTPLELEQKEYIENKIKTSSQNYPFSIYYINFLYPKYQMVENRRVHEAIDVLTMPGAMTKVALTAVKKNLLTIPKDDDTREWRFGLQNESCTIHYGNVLTEYRKAMYFHESDDFFLRDNPPSVFYNYGDGEDHCVTKNNVSGVTLSTISTEICWDEICGIRYGNNWTNKESKSPDQSKLHIVQSNIANIRKDGCGNLPGYRYVVQADRAYKSVFCKNQVDEYGFLDPKKTITVDLGGDTYTIDIFQIVGDDQDYTGGV